MPFPRLTPLRIYNLAMAGAVFFVTLCLVFYPEEGFKAATDGLKLFFEIVFPSLLPFFILSELMLGLGIVHCLGVFLEPLMRPIFNVPGVGAFAMSMGLAAGYPMDAVITGKFRRAGMCTRIEGERLLAFTNTADPLFIIGAVAVGMFHRPELGMLMAAAHYLSSFAVGLVFRFYGRNDPEKSCVNEAQLAGNSDKNIFRKAMRELEKARKKDGRPIGQLMAEAVKESVSTLLMICGFIVLFSVIITIFKKIGFVGILSPFIGGVLKFCGIDTNLAPAVIQGVFEIDIGAMAAAEATAPFLEKVIIAGAIIAWSGFSVHGQVASVLHGTDIHMAPYVAARLLQAVFAGIFTFLLYGPVSTVIHVFNIPVLASRVLLTNPYALQTMNLVQRVCFSTLQWVLIMAFLLLTVLFMFLRQRVRIIWIRRK